MTPPLLKSHYLSNQSSYQTAISVFLNINKLFITYQKQNTLPSILAEYGNNLQRKISCQFRDFLTISGLDFLNKIELYNFVGL